MANPAEVVLVHGGWHGAWCWERVVPLLAVRGITAVAVDLPSCAGVPGAGLAADADAVRSVLDRAGGPVVLCGHSYGGLVITEAGEHPAVRHLVYLAALMADEHDDCHTLLVEGGSLAASGVEPLEDQRIIIRPDVAREAFYGDCAAADADAALARLRPLSVISPMSPTKVAWRHRPSTYVVCTQDRAMPPAVARTFAARAGTVIEWRTDHSPFLSHPQWVADLLIGLATSA